MLPGPVAVQQGGEFGKRWLLWLRGGVFGPNLKKYLKLGLSWKDKGPYRALVCLCLGRRGTCRNEFLFLAFLIHPLFSDFFFSTSV